ncbi:MAG: hypothetical protein ACPLZY_03390, partial [Candidatus Norongarragalinales archaeon]
MNYYDDYDNYDDYYDENGCCLTCEFPEERKGWNGIYGDGCLCFDCKCSKCLNLSGHTCELAFPPKGYVELTWSKQRETLTVKIYPYIENNVFREIVAILKDYFFTFDATNKTWTIPTNN